MPTREQVERSREIAERAIQRYRGRMQITYVLPDYYELYRKPAMGVWGKLYLVVTPNGQLLPCHGATQSPRCDSMTSGSLTGVDLAGVGSVPRHPGRHLDEGTLPELPAEATDFGGCRCQAFALTGDACETPIRSAP